VAHPRAVYLCAERGRRRCRSRRHRRSATIRRSLSGRPRTHAPTLEWDSDPDEYPAELERVVARELERYAPDAVAGFGYDFGHTDPAFPLPLGAVATLDPADGAIRFGSD
jgi:hypothetical protein